MREFILQSFYVLLFLGIYGLAALLWIFSYYVNRWCDKSEPERLAMLAELKEAEQRDEARKRGIWVASSSKHSKNE